MDLQTSNSERHTHMASKGSAFTSILSLGFTILALRGCGDDEGARKTLANDVRFKPDAIQVDGHKWFGCDATDFYHTEFHAKNTRNQDVHGVVCSGLLFKGTTIRTFD